MRLLRFIAKPASWVFHRLICVPIVWLCPMLDLAAQAEYEDLP